MSNNTDNQTDEETIEEETVFLEDGERSHRLERTDTGYVFSVKSKRGTGTNDRDTVKAELKTEERPSEDERNDVVSDVTQAMNNIRFNQPDE